MKCVNCECIVIVDEQDNTWHFSGHNKTDCKCRYPERFEGEEARSLKI